MDLVDAVRGGGGVVLSAPLRQAGATSRAITAAVASGALVRPRRGWLAVPDADAVLVKAAAAGVVLSCVTHAVRLGLWVLTAPAHVHVAASAHAGAVRAGNAVVHWGLPSVPRPPGSLVDAIENTLFTAAACQPFEAALTIWESALRKQLVEHALLGRLHLSGRARAVFDAASPWSDSGLETLVIPRLRWMRLSLRRQVWLYGHHVDLLIGERLVLQIDGGTHVGPQRDADIAHDAVLLLHGFHVIRVGYSQVVNDWPGVQNVIMRAVAKRLHLGPRER